MDENLTNLDENIEIYTEDVEQIVESEETTEVVEVEPVEEVEIEVDEAVGWVGGDSTRHYSLYGRDEPDQHPITSIIGLREELNDIEALDVVYSNERNQANYYLWQDENLLQEDRIGYFVSACDDINEIKLCTSDNDIFGVTVDNAGFIGAQADIPRDIKYGLVVTTGVVHVRCESSVNVGDYVISNEYGYAQKNENGYKVVGRHRIDGVEYAEITLVTPINRICRLSDNVNNVSQRMDDAEKNIVSAVNVANEAYNKAGEASDVSEEAVKNALEALSKADDTSKKTDGFEQRLENSNTVAAQAKAIAESAATSAESIRNEAVKKANEALENTNGLRKEFESTISQMQTDLDNAFLELQEAEENITSTRDDLQTSINSAVEDLEKLEKDLEPLATWPDAENPIGIAGFVSRADEDSATLASVTKFEGEFGESITGFVQEATKENATVKTIANYQQKDENGNVINNGASGLISQVDANTASINLLTELEGEGFSGLAGLLAKVDANSSSITTLASHVVGEFENVDDWVEGGKDVTKIYYAKNNRRYYYYNQGWKSTDKTYEAGLIGSIARVQNVADDNKAQLDAMVAYDKNGKSALAGLTVYVDENSASINTLANYSNDDSGNSGVAGLVADVDDNTSTLSAVVNHQFTKNDGTTVTGLAGLNAYVNENESNIAFVADRVSGKYTVLEESWNEADKDISMVYYVKAAPDEDKDLWYYYDGDWKSTEDPYEAGLPRVMAGIQAKTDENSASIDNLTSWRGETNDSMARIEQKADKNGASINSIVSSVDKYSVGEYSQAYGLTYEQAKNILTTGMIYVPTKHNDIQSHSEIFEDTQETNEFTPGSYYMWNGEDWIEYRNSVAFFSTEPTPSDILQYWYIDSNEAPEGYEPHALYVNKDGQWIKLNILDGNVNNRATSIIKQATNKLSLAVTNAQGSIDLVVSDGKINTASIITAINESDSTVQLSAKHIIFEGDVVATEDFSLTGGNIYLPDGGKVIGGDGMFSNLQFTSSGDVGFYINQLTQSVNKRYVELNAFIPDDFTANQAILTLRHRPHKVSGIYFDEDSLTQKEFKDISCSAKNIQLYKVTKEDAFVYSLNSEVLFDTNIEKTLTNTFGSGWNPNNANQSVEISVSLDIANLNSGYNRFFIETKDSAPSYPTTFNNYTNILSQTGTITAYLDVFGYMRVGT